MNHKQTPSCLHALQWEGMRGENGREARQAGMERMFWLPVLGSTQVLGDKKKAARQIAQGHFLFQRSPGVKEAIFLGDNQRWVGSRGGGWRRGKEGGRMGSKTNAPLLQSDEEGNIWSHRRNRNWSTGGIVWHLWHFWPRKRRQWIQTLMVPD